MRLVIVQRKIVASLSLLIKYFILILRKKPIHLERIPEEIPDNSPISSEDIIGDLGSVLSVISASVYNTRKNIEENTIRKLWLIFRPTVAFSKRPIKVLLRSETKKVKHSGEKRKKLQSQNP
ncbi:MAG: hypothetical protein M0O93_02585 [Bacteroidales bacterium]|nr:hypothetical protein [Bacteroidales bacterium]